MSYIHSVIGVMVADDIMRRKKVLNKLQQELFDLMKDELVNGNLIEFIPGFSEDNLDAILEDLRKDISTMDAIDLRKNIKIWKEDISFGRKR